MRHLLVHLRVPVTVEHDDCISGLQVQAQPSCPRGQCEDEVGRVGLVEVLQHSSPVVGTTTLISMGKAGNYAKAEGKLGAPSDTFPSNCLTASSVLVFDYFRGQGGMRCCA